MARKERGTSRLRQRAALLEAASHVDIPKETDVCVVGGGAAGLVAGIIAAEEGAKVVVIEKNPTCGKSILATGNGRCNFANTRLDPQLYNDPSFVQATCGRQWLADTLEFFAQSGLAWADEAQGRLYPLSRQAASVQSVLLQRASRAGVVLAPARDVMRLLATPSNFSLAWQEQWPEGSMKSAHAKTVVVATGGFHALDLKGLGLNSTALSPLLCPLACTHPLLARLDGRRVRAAARLLRNNRIVATEQGEVLFRGYGVSGIAMFNLSRHVLRGDKLLIDLLPSLSLEEAWTLGTKTLDGLLDPVVAHVLEESAPTRQDALAQAKSFALCVTGLAETDQAQVHRGGLSTNQFDPSTLECGHVRGLFACGEALDVDGPCGGYNLAWAWKSGMVAGSAAAKEALR